MSHRKRFMPTVFVTRDVTPPPPRPPGRPSSIGASGSSGAPAAAAAPAPAPPPPPRPTPPRPPPPPAGAAAASLEYLPTTLPLASRISITTGPAGSAGRKYSIIGPKRSGFVRVL